MTFNMTKHQVRIWQSTASETRVPLGDFGDIAPGTAALVALTTGSRAATGKGSTRMRSCLRGGPGFSAYRVIQPGSVGTSSTRSWLSRLAPPWPLTLRSTSCWCPSGRTSVAAGPCTCRPWRAPPSPGTHGRGHGTCRSCGICPRWSIWTCPLWNPPGTRKVSELRFWHGQDSIRWTYLSLS